MGALAGLMWALQLSLFYGLMAAVIYLLFKVQKELGKVKQTLVDLQETVALTQLPREPKA